MGDEFTFTMPPVAAGAPAWVAPEASAEAHQRSWAELVRQRIKSLACSSLAVEITLNKEVPRV